MKFSQRIGQTPVVKEIQLDKIDSDLKNGLWNILKIQVLDEIKDEPNYYYNINIGEYFCRGLYADYYKLPIDEKHYYLRENLKELEGNFMGSQQWYYPYDLIEFVLELISPFTNIFNLGHIEKLFNVILEREFSAYRLNNLKFIPITNTNEVSEISDALKLTESSNLQTCNLHLKTAIQLLSDRKSPDYRNSIKESISSVESISKIISGKSSDSLGSALDKLRGKISLHPSLERGFKQIYGYTSDGDGIRHALSDLPNCDFDDAKFMLVSCSAFVNYLVAKSLKAGIKI